MTKAEQARETISAVLSDHRPACLTCSFQAESMVLLDLLRESRPEIPVLFVDTGYHFPEVYRYRDEMMARYGLNLLNLTPEKCVAEQEAEFGLLYESQPDQCCKVRKVQPLFSALEAYEIWFTGLRRAQSPTRANVQVRETFPLPTGKQLTKVSPLVDWSHQEIWDYVDIRQIPLLPLYEAGYTSIGCEPCTAIPSDPSNPRSGRWGGRKLECGIHVPANQLIPLVAS